MKKKLILYACLIGLLMTSCQSRFLDLSSQQAYIILNRPENYQFGSPAWLSDEVIVFVGKPSNSDRKTPSLFLAYNILGQQWKTILVPTNQNCQISGFSFPEKLPNGHIGFVDTCITNGKEIRTIIEINISTGKTQTLMDSGPIRVAGKFSFSPDMTELVQEDMIGRFLSNKLFYRKNDDSIQIVPNFTRAMYPDWSPHDRKIAFWGTESYPGGEPNGFTTLPEILGLSSYSWDLFTATPDGTNIVKVLSSVDDALLIKWSPTERIIAFSGTIDGASGVFLANPETSEVTRIWSTLGDFDWSPDGNKIVVLDTEEDKNGKLQNKNIYVIEIK